MKHDSHRQLSGKSGILFFSLDSAYPNAPIYAATDHETERAC